jgi:hypothetical protein
VHISHLLPFPTARFNAPDDEARFAIVVEGKGILIHTRPVDDAMNAGDLFTIYQLLKQVPQINHVGPLDRGRRVIFLRFLIPRLQPRHITTLKQLCHDTKILMCPNTALKRVRTFRLWRIV